MQLSNDALFELVGDVDIDSYINAFANSFEAQSQIGGTCWANAIAAAYLFAMHRILEREGGYPTFL